MHRTHFTVLALGLPAVTVLAVLGMSAAPSQERGPLVRIERVEHRTLEWTLDLEGSVQPGREVRVRSELPGRVQRVHVTPGQAVSAGDLLLELDAAAYRLRARSLEAALAAAQAAEAEVQAERAQASALAERAERLLQVGDFVTRADVERARAELQMAEARLDAARFHALALHSSLQEARAAVEKTVLRAPVSGRVNEVLVRSGENVIPGTGWTAGSVLITLHGDLPPHVRVRVDETDVPHVALGDSARVRFSALPGLEFAGHVARVAQNATGPRRAGSQVADGSPVEYEVVVSLDDPPPSLRADLTARVELLLERRRDVLTVDRIAVALRRPPTAPGARAEQGRAPGTAGPLPSPADSVTGVFRFHAGRVEFVPVRIGIGGESHFEILEGLEAGDLVVTGPFASIGELRHGMAVRPSAPLPRLAAAERERRLAAR